MGNVVHYFPTRSIVCIPRSVYICRTQSGRKSNDALEDLEISSIRPMHVHPILRMDGL